MGTDYRSKEYHCWVRMKHRCHNPEYKGYETYGGRGIRVCQRWRWSYDDFLADMGRAPTAEHSIERTNNNGPYSCGHCEECRSKGWTAHCVWATKIEQANNRRTNVRIEFRGFIKTMQQWAEFLGISRKCIWKRLKLRDAHPERWPLEKVLAPWPPAAEEQRLAA